MSRYSFDAHYNSEPVEVVLGWDPPLQGFFMYIERVNGNGDDDPQNFIWSNIYDAEIAHPHDIEPFLLILREHGITVPPNILIDVVTKT